MRTGWCTSSEESRKRKTKSENEVKAMSRSQATIKRWRFLLPAMVLLLALGVILFLLPSIRGWWRTRDATRLRTPVNTSEREMIATSLAVPDLAKHSGIAFGSDAELLHATDGGKIDPWVGYFRWIVRTRTPVSVPTTKNCAPDPYCPTAVEASLEVIAHATGHEFQVAAFSGYSSSWKVDVFQYDCTVLESSSKTLVLIHRNRSDYPP